MKKVQIKSPDASEQKKAANVEELAKNPQVEAVVITTPGFLHFEHFKICANQGKHCFVNVPVTTDPKEAESMIHLAEKNCIIYMAGHNLRKNKGIMRIKEVVTGCEIGSPHIFEANVSYPGSFELPEDSWRCSKKTSPILPFAQYAVVFLDLLLDFWGPPEKVSAYMTKMDGRGDAPDMGTVTSVYPDGRLAYIGCSYISHSTFELTVYGREGKAQWNRPDRNSVTLSRPEASTRTEFEEVDEQYEELDEFAHCIRESIQPTVGGVQAYHVAEFFRCIENSVQNESIERFRMYQKS